MLAPANDTLTVISAKVETKKYNHYLCNSLYYSNNTVRMPLLVSTSSVLVAAQQLVTSGY